MFPLLAEATAGDVTIPWQALVGIAATLSAAIAWLAVELRRSNERTNTQTIGLVEKVTAALTASTLALNTVAGLMDQQRRLIEKETPR